MIWIDKSNRELIKKHRGENRNDAYTDIIIPLLCLIKRLFPSFCQKGFILQQFIRDSFEYLSQCAELKNHRNREQDKCLYFMHCIGNNIMHKSIEIIVQRNKIALLACLYHIDVPLACISTKVSNSKSKTFLIWYNESK